MSLDTKLCTVCNKPFDPFYQAGATICWSCAKKKMEGSNALSDKIEHLRSLDRTNRGNSCNGHAISESICGLKYGVASVTTFNLKITIGKEFDIVETLPELERKIKLKEIPYPVTGLDGFFYMPSGFAITVTRVNDLTSDHRYIALLKVDSGEFFTRPISIGEVLYVHRHELDTLVDNVQ